MRILYGIQGTGNGHISRALEIVPALKKHAEVDILVSGVHSELTLPFELTYRMHGLGFVFGKNGGIDLLSTYKRSRLKKFYKEVKELPVADYDLVISDFEPVTAWACMAAGKKCVGLSNQASLLSPNVPTAGNDDLVGRFIIRHYAPCTSYYGLSFERYDHNVFTPVIRKSLRETPLSDEGHITVYLPAYSDERIVKVLGSMEGVDWQVFSKYAMSDYQVGNVSMKPLDKETFEKSFASAHGIVTAAGFGTTTEALFMGKKLLVIPQKHQYEQACNALALKEMGVAVIKSLKMKHAEKIQYWLAGDRVIKKEYPEVTDEIVAEILSGQQAVVSHTGYTPGGPYLPLEQ